MKSFKNSDKKYFFSNMFCTKSNHFFVFPSHLIQFILNYSFMIFKKSILHNQTLKIFCHLLQKELNFFWINFCIILNYLFKFYHELFITVTFDFWKICFYFLNYLFIIPCFFKCFNFFLSFYNFPVFFQPIKHFEYAKSIYYQWNI